MHDAEQDLHFAFFRFLGLAELGFQFDLFGHIPQSDEQAVHLAVHHDAAEGKAEVAGDETAIRIGEIHFNIGERIDAQHGALLAFGVEQEVEKVPRGFVHLFRQMELQDFIETAAGQLLLA